MMSDYLPYKIGVLQSLDDHQASLLDSAVLYGAKEVFLGLGVISSVILITNLIMMYLYVPSS